MWKYPKLYIKSHHEELPCYDLFLSKHMSQSSLISFLESTATQIATSTCFILLSSLRSNIKQQDLFPVTQTSHSKPEREEATPAASLEQPTHESGSTFRHVLIGLLSCASCILLLPELAPQTKIKVSDGADQFSDVIACMCNPLPQCSDF